jgi:hypothetical protein
MTQLTALINELETKIAHCEKINTAVSKTAVGWHIQHSLLVAMQIISAVEKSNPADYKYKFSLLKFIVYIRNKIPRGKAKAPDRVMPKETFNADVLKKDFELLKNRIEVLHTLEPRHFFIHPYFGNLNLKDTIKMLKLHTKHHINIINDIIKD